MVRYLPVTINMSALFPPNLTVKQAVLSTLAFFDIFGTPLSREEISEYLLGMKPDHQKIDIYLKESPLIQIQSGAYSLKGNTLYYQRFEERKARALKYWKKIKRYQWLFQLCPFVELVCVCNSLPFQAVDEDSDIDLFVVAKKNRLFSARLALTVLTGIFGVRRHGNKIRARFCLSFYVTDDHLNLEEILLRPFDVYLAFWLHSLEPIAGNFETYKTLQAANWLWLKDYFQGLPQRKRYFRKSKPWQMWVKKHLESWLDKDAKEERTKQIQLDRAKAKRFLLKDASGTIISDSILKFHDHDLRKTFQEEWLRKLEEIL